MSDADPTIEERITWENGDLVVDDDEPDGPPPDLPSPRPLAPDGR